ncbi:MAG: hypothetical protein ABIY70_16450 [Capsulimonas sp.]|jgi:hypothetical protein|uniref:hypothetical protein n=1 Tax=Capsulimonas sp. TaxID=2494211 RepID=UPI00326620A2
MLRHYHDAYQRILASMNDEDLAPLYARTAGEHPAMARLIAEEIARRETLWNPQFSSSEPRFPELAAAA